MNVKGVSKEPKNQQERGAVLPRQQIRPQPLFCRSFLIYLTGVLKYSMRYVVIIILLLCAGCAPYPYGYDYDYYYPDYSYHPSPYYGPYSSYPYYTPYYGPYYSPYFYGGHRGYGFGFR